jgi:hypothetical protein
MADPDNEMTDDERRRLLELLATADDSCTADLLLALGFTPDLVLGVVRAGLATAQTETTCCRTRGSSFSRAHHGRRPAGAGGTAGVIPHSATTAGSENQIGGIQKRWR